MPFEEFVTSWGIVDLVGIRANVDKVLERIAAEQTEPIGDLRSVLMLLAVPLASSRRSITLEEIKLQFGEMIGEAAIDRIIARLVKKRMLAVTSRGHLVRLIANLPFHEELICVELKLTRIEDVIAQARRHRVIATGSYVGLPATVAEKVAFSSRRSDFEDSGVGLLSISDDNCFVLIPASSNIRERERAYEIAAAEKGWRAISKAIQH